jgi:methyl-accepting chemotaxis protein
LFVAYGLAGFAIFNHWQNGLVGEGTDEMIRGISAYFANESDFIRHTLDPVITEKLVREGMRELSLEEQYALIVNKQFSDYQRFYNQFCADLVERSALGLDAVFVILSGMGIPGGSTVVVSNDESMIYEWPVPSYLLEAIDDETPYLYLEGGVPELGLEGEHIIFVEVFSYAQLTQAYVGVKSLRAEVGEMRDFYESERKAVSARYIPTVAVSLVALVLLSLLVLGFLLRRNITRPVEELSEAAGRVMQGDLDVEIAVREGEDLAGLQRAFREMVESLRRLISRSVEGD